MTTAADIQRLTKILENNKYMKGNDMKKAEHTPTPWQLAEGNKRIIYSRGHTVTCVTESQNGINEAVANAKFIQRAVNSHYELVGALKECVRLLADYEKDEESEDQDHEEWIAYKAALKALDKATQN